MIFHDQEFRPQVITEVQEILDNWEFFLEGLEELNELCEDEEDRVTSESLLKTLLYILTRSPEDGIICIVRSKTGKPLLWYAGVNNTVLFKPRSCAVYAVYSNKKAKGVVRYAIQHGETWARQQGFSRLQAFTPCFNGSRFRLFEKVWRFRRSAVVFTKKL